MRNRYVSLSSAQSGIERLITKLTAKRSFVVCRAGKPVVQLVLPDPLGRRVRRVAKPRRRRRRPQGGSH